MFVLFVNVFEVARPATFILLPLILTNARGHDCEDNVYEEG